MARVDIKGEQHPVSEVFSERYAFVVPPYQRPYAWTSEHASELYDDLLTALGDSSVPVEELNPYARLVPGERVPWREARLRREGAQPQAVVYHRR
ncbi:MAG TPA: DUF262 domain-containing protein [Ktedonobacterales bacterium]